MKKLGTVLLTLCTAIASNFVSASTVGTLTYNGGTNLITDSATGTTYLGWDVLADSTYAQTLAATQAGGAYEGYHIANQTEAYAFYNAASGNISHVDTYGLNHYATNLGLTDGIFGDNYNGISDYAFFLSDELHEVGLIFIDAVTGKLHIFDNWDTIMFSDEFSSSGMFSDGPISWILVSDQNISPVPVPAALPLFATALAAFGWMRRRKPVKTS